MLVQAEGGVVAEAAATHQSNEDTNAAAAEMEQAEGRLAAEAAATRNLGEDANAAAHNLGADANITAAKKIHEDANAASTKEEAKITGDVPRSQNNKNEKTSEGDYEIRKLIEERRNTAKGDRHQLNEFSKRIKKVHQREKKRKDRKIQRILEELRGMKNTPKTFAVLFLDVTVSPLSFFTFGMSVFFFSDFMQYIFYTKLYA